MKVPSVENDFKSSLKHEIKEIETPKHKNDKGQVRTASGIGITGMLGAISLEAVDLLGEHVAEIVGGYTVPVTGYHFSRVGVESYSIYVVDCHCYSPCLFVVCLLCCLLCILAT